jgi:hypothetical protein
MHWRDGFSKVVAVPAGSDTGGTNSGWEPPETSSRFRPTSADAPIRRATGGRRTIRLVSQHPAMRSALPEASE